MLTKNNCKSYIFLRNKCQDTNSEVELIEDINYPIILDSAEVVEVKNFQFIEKPIENVPDLKIIKYTGKKTAKFLINLSSNSNVDENITQPVKINFFVSKGENGNLPDTTNQIIFQVANLTNLITHNSENGIITLKKNDTIWFYFNVEQNIPKNGLVFDTFSVTISEI